MEQPLTASGSNVDQQPLTAAPASGANMEQPVSMPVSDLPASATPDVAVPPAAASVPDPAAAAAAAAAAVPAVNVECGPLLNYKYTSGQDTQAPIWHGSVLVVVLPGVTPPELNVSLNVPDRTASDAPVPDQGSNVEPVFLYADEYRAFYRYVLHLPMRATESEWVYSLPNTTYGDRHPAGTRFPFVIPSATQSMRMMFHSCNGFSVGTDMKQWSGPNGVVWKNVLKFHQDQPFHVMIGGGDQIYNDGIRVDGPLRPWSDMRNPVKRRKTPFTEKLRAECDEYYAKKYVNWFGSDHFATANATIPQLNIWDDHDIIDGFGSYTDKFMHCGVFRGIGGVAHKYYLLFQQHLAPPLRTFVTDDTQPDTEPQAGTTPASKSVRDEDLEDPMYVIGPKPGPYVQERSRSIVTQLGARIAFAGVDARTERTRHQINYPGTYDLLFERIEQQIRSFPETKHLILLLGVPIAYPRLQWLENIFSSPLMAPLAFLNRRFGFGGNFFNRFDGNVDLLDDLDDHYTARLHKTERRDLIHRLQILGKEFGVRVTILSGDVHLAAIGRFYSRKQHQLPAHQDWRFITNIVSSAITNMPPPSAVANLLARRNKIHHLDHDTDETMLEMFDRSPAKAGQGAPVVGPDGERTRPTSPPKKKKASSNVTTMPSRNFVIIEEGAMLPAPEPRETKDAGAVADVGVKGTKNPRYPIHPGEQGAGTKHPAAAGINLQQRQNGDLNIDSGDTALSSSRRHVGLNVAFRVEVDGRDGTGDTDGYGVWIPPLEISKDTAVPSAPA